MTRAANSVLIAGAGPVGLSAAAALARRGVPVTVLEAEPDLVRELRGSTFHPSTLDMLDELGGAAPLIAQGLVAPELQFRTKRDGRIAQFDFAAIADVTRHPYRVQCEQYRSQTHTIRNKQDLEAKDPEAHEEFKRRIRDTAGDPAKAREYLLRASMIASLRRAEELG